MIITWYGQSCFKLQDSQQIVLTDPLGPRKNGLRGPNLRATIVLLTDPNDEKTIKTSSHQRVDNGKQSPERDFFLINGPGEYEIENIFIYGIDFIRKDKRLTVYRLEMEGIHFGFLGEINALLNDSEMERLGNLDVLFVPVGGQDLSGRQAGGRQTGMIDAKKAIEMINSLEPKLVIPCCFKIPGMKTDLMPVTQFLQQAGIKNIEKFSKLSLHKKHLLNEQTKIVVLEPGG